MLLDKINHFFLKVECYMLMSNRWLGAGGGEPSEPFESRWRSFHTAHCQRGITKSTRVYFSNVHDCGEGNIVCIQHLICEYYVQNSVSYHQPALYVLTPMGLMTMCSKIDPPPPPPVVQL